MSELMNASKSFKAFHGQLLTTACVVALIILFQKSDQAKASGADDGHPTVWVELGGQLERFSDSQPPFIAPFLTQTPTPEPFAPISPIQAQQPPRYGFGGEGRLLFEPEGSGWIFSAAVRYGRANGGKHVQKSIPREAYQSFPTLYPSKYKTPLLEKFAETKTKQSESHAIIDFQAGKDVGLGMFGGGSTVSVGVRFAQFVSKSHTAIHAIPTIMPSPHYPAGYFKYKFNTHFNTYSLTGSSARSFHGVGPSLSWNASVPVAGKQDGEEFTFDWGLNAAVLFGRQRASVHHETEEYAHFHTPNFNLNTAIPKTTFRYHSVTDRTRSRAVTVPNLGGFAGLSLKFPNAKISLGYRADFFFGPMDAGIDTRHTEDMSFHGPFASISVGLGG